VPGVEIDTPAGSALPLDGRWISEEIVKKAAKYGEERQFAIWCFSLVSTVSRSRAAGVVALWLENRVASTY
jgi:hypothetical protein